ncbi:MAG: hypothetical protein KDB35_22580 [Acidimicrobiales bacterium]|nr:hypothetical protein [Acidimicrobiales bacterium]MCB1017678.1 hypothetical protein [Acidimicrobiales bacterium]MCB9372223.1 hypothetical protein [Microthrixaceae bacterium]
MSAPATAAPPPTERHGEHRRLLVGDLVVRRITYRSVSRVAWPFLAALYGALLGVAVVGWNVAALLGWSPAEHGLDGLQVFWTAVAAGAVLVPAGVGLALVLAALYNAVSERTGGLQVAVVSPRRAARRAEGGLTPGP